MTDATIKKIVVTVIALAMFAVWNLMERPSECTNNCNTEFSAKHR